MKVRTFAASLYNNTLPINQQTTTITELRAWVQIKEFHNFKPFCANFVQIKKPNSPELG
jgi:hypothetical protein